MIDQVRLIQRVSRWVLGWLDDRTGAPIMRRRVNAGSDKYFRYAQLTKGRSELDDLPGSRRLEDEDDESLTDDQAVAKRYASVRWRVIVTAAAMLLSVVLLLGHVGLGPLVGLAKAPESGRFSPVLTFGFFSVVGAVRLVRLRNRALRLRAALAAHAAVEAEAASRHIVSPQ